METDSGSYKYTTGGPGNEDRRDSLLHLPHVPQGHIFPDLILQGPLMRAGPRFKS